MEQWIDEEEQSERFVIDDDSKAEWALRRVKEAREQRDRMLAHLNHQRDAANALCRRTEEQYSAELMAYFKTLPVRKAKTQESYALPSGKLVLKHPGVEYKRDEAALVEWLKGNGMVEMVKTVYEPRWGELKPLTQVVGDAVVYTATGEVVAGVVPVERPDEFRMEV